MRFLMLLIPVVWAFADVPANAGSERKAGVATAPAATLARAEPLNLVMVDDPACQYCRRWHEEVGGGYGRTAEGRAAPLKRVGRDSKVLSDFAPVVYTPTFILVRDGRELGRITGYPGQFYFWEELTQLMSSVGMKTKG